MNITFNTTINGFTSQVSSQLTYTGTSVQDLRDVLPSGASNQTMAYGLDVSQIEFFYANSDKDVTLVTYSGATQKDTLTLTANTPLIYSGDIGTTPFPSGDFTSIKGTNNAGASANVTLLTLLDATP